MDTRATVMELLRRIAAGDPRSIAELYADEVDWLIDWPAGSVADAVPWIRHRGNREAVAQHYADLAAHNRTADPPTSVDHVLVDGDDAVVFGTIRNIMIRTGRAYAAGFSLRLTVRDGLITRHHIYEDSLAVASAWFADAIPTQP